MYKLSVKKIRLFIAVIALFLALFVIHLMFYQEKNNHQSNPKLFKDNTEIINYDGRNMDNKKNTCSLFNRTRFVKTLEQLVELKLLDDNFLDNSILPENIHQVSLFLNSLLSGKSINVSDIIYKEENSHELHDKSLESLCESDIIAILYLNVSTKSQMAMSMPAFGVCYENASIALVSTVIFLKNDKTYFLPKKCAYDNFDVLLSNIGSKSFDPSVWFMETKMLSKPMFSVINVTYTEFNELQIEGIATLMDKADQHSPPFRVDMFYPVISKSTSKRNPAP